MLGNITYATSHKRPFVPSVWGIRLLYNVQAESQVRFLKLLQGVPTWLLFLPMVLCTFVTSKWLEGGNLMSPLERNIPRISRQLFGENNF